MVEMQSLYGEQLAAPGSFKSFPFRLLIAFAATFPARGDSFWLDVTNKKNNRPTSKLGGYS